MKNLRLVPFALLLIYFLVLRAFPEMSLMIKLIFAAVIIVISTYFMMKLIKAGTLQKQSMYIFGGFIILILSITSYFIYFVK